MPSPLNQAAAQRAPTSRGLQSARLRCARARGDSRTLPLVRGVALCGSLALLAFIGCQAAGRRDAPQTRFYPPAPQKPHVVALGALRGDPPPTEAEVQLAVFLFGTEPPAPLGIANPAGLSATRDGLLICDPLLDAIFVWSDADERFAEVRFDPILDGPFDVDVAPDGQTIVCDHHGVLVLDAVGVFQRKLKCPYARCKPGGAIIVDDEIWVSNLIAQRIEVFDLAAGEHIRSIGRRGHGPGEFAMPRGLARTPDGNICVVDTLNNRVQILDPDGNYVRTVGQPGDTNGSFGRPRDVAVGPDGVIFVTDAFSQRVHAFDSEGMPLLAFGEPGSGVGELAMPHGIAIATRVGHVDQPLPDDLEAEYYVLVAEQLREPGVRVYAWVGAEPGELAATSLSDEPSDWQPRFPESAAINPHFHDGRCDTCHKGQAAPFQAIPLAESDALCLECHDGIRAPADPHPIGRPATTEVVVTPADWPTPGGDIACLTCHDIVRHCETGTRRPAENPDLLRGWNPRRPLIYCSNCHQDDVAGRFSPHLQRDSTGRVRDDACLFCHTQRPDVPEHGRRQFEPLLRVESSQLCLNCHSPHWDMSPEGHVDRPVTPRIRQWMLVRELGREKDAPLAELERLAAQRARPPARLPLGEGDIVTCYTCHNPHYTGLFPADSELGAMADHPQDRRSALRTDWILLCSECHNR